MATPLSPDTWLRVLRAEGVTVQEYPGWRTRERDAPTGKAFGPVRMFLNHHTAGRNSRDVVAKNGVPGLPAPLAHVYLAKSGVATMCSAGRANHAGLMAVNAYASFRDEKSSHPAPSRSSGTVDGNDVAYGIETENLGDGRDVYPREQYDAWVRINAAVCRHHGWGAESVGCHKETSIEGKVDPRGPVEGYGSRGRFEYTPDRFRADVAERLRHEPGWSPGEEEEDDMAMTRADADLVADRVWAHMEAAGDDDPKRVGAIVGWLDVVHAKQNAALAALAAQVGALSATVGRLAEGGGLDATEIRAAAEAGAQAALAQLGDALKEG